MRAANVNTLVGRWTVALLIVAALPAVTYAQTPECPEEITYDLASWHYSLYYEDFRTGNYASALPDLRWMITCAPVFPTPPIATSGA
jgi:hypothetical protein